MARYISAIIHDVYLVIWAVWSTYSKRSVSKHVLSCAENMREITRISPGFADETELTDAGDVSEVRWTNEFCRDRGRGWIGAGALATELFVISDLRSWLRLALPQPDARSTPAGHPLYFASSRDGDVLPQPLKFPDRAFSRCISRFFVHFSFRVRATVDVQVDRF